MKTTSLFERALMVIVMAGITGAATNGQKQNTIPVTTKSAAARREYEMGMMHYEDLLLVDEGLEFFREAVKTDPQFALGHAMLGFATFDPAEASRHRALAKQYI